MNLRSRLTALEAGNSNQIALVAWWLGADGRAATRAGGIELEQVASESIPDFLGRAALNMPGKKVLWIDERDQRL